jgi:hypothetical protein
MRIWTLHPKYLDARGLTALWRETLLAQKVLAGETRGYRHHPQLARFKAAGDPLALIAAYLAAVHVEAARRGYNFDAAKIRGAGHAAPARAKIEATDGQLAFEWQHLLRKLARRDPPRFAQFQKLSAPDPHPLFRLVPGSVQDWEVVSAKETRP